MPPNNSEQWRTPSEENKSGSNENTNLAESLELCAQETEEGKQRVRELEEWEKEEKEVGQ